MLNSFRFVIILSCLASPVFQSKANAEEAESPAKTDFYDPVERVIEGWTIKLDPQLLEEKHQEFAAEVQTALANHLQRVRYILPGEKVRELRHLPIWLELNNPKLGSMQYHPNRGWLVRNGHDPRLAKHVHIPRARALLNPHTWAKHPYVVLHELAHAYHDQVLSFDNKEVIEAYTESRNAKIYEKVLLFTGKEVRHYALTNHKEYFAEMTESYLGVNDFYPFVRAELSSYDPKTFALMEKIWGPIR